MKTIELPGLDDCNWLYVMSSRSGHTSVYFKIHKIDGKIYGQLTVDSNAPEGANFCQELTPVNGPFPTVQDAALEMLSDAQDWFMDNGLQFAYDTNLRKLARK